MLVTTFARAAFHLYSFYVCSPPVAFPDVPKSASSSALELCSAMCQINKPLPFHMQQVLEEAKSQAAGGVTIGGMSVGHIAHLGGALAGVMLVYLISKIPEADTS